MAPLFAVIVPVIILMCGLALDTSRLELRTVQLQAAADAAALGAELAIERGMHDYTTIGQQDAAINGATDGANNTTVAIAQVPTYGEYSGYYDAVQVSITQRVSTVFMGALNGGSRTLSVKATALVPPCSYFLGAASSQYSYTFYNASSGMNASCPVDINTNFEVDGFAYLIGFGINVAGSAANSLVTGWTSQQGQGNQTPGPPHYGTLAVSDPLTAITQPVFSSCDHTSYSVSNTSVTLRPGTYCGTSLTTGMTFSHATVTLDPGLYIITGGAKWIDSTVTGTGVTLFFTKGNGAGYGQFQDYTDSTNCTSTTTLSAPVDASNGGIPRILFFADRNWVPSSSSDFQMVNWVNFTGDGIWYMPNTGLYLWACTIRIPTYGGFVVNNMYNFNSSLYLSENFSSIASGNPFRTKAVLVQ